MEVLYKLRIATLTCTRKPTICISTVASAGVAPLGVVASCIVMTHISASSAFIHICSSKSCNNGTQNATA